MRFKRGPSTMNSKPDLLQLHNSIKQSRKDLLDFLEIAYGHQENWLKVRAKIMKIFGRDGLESFFIGNGRGGRNGEEKNK